VTLQYNADLRLLNELLLFSSVFYFYFQFVILYLLISVGTQLHNLFFVVSLVIIPGDYFYIIDLLSF